MRKELDLDYADRIVVSVESGAEIAQVLEEHGALIAGETLATTLSSGAPREGATTKELTVDAHAIVLGMEKA